MRISGSVSTSATTETAIEGTAYTEQIANAQRGVKSSSANDAAAGTGVRKVRITYYTLAADGTIAGPFIEDVTLNGVAAVATVATIALIEKIEAISVGSGGVAAGTITLAAAADGTGTVIGTIAVGKRTTEWAHHYIPNGRRAKITDLIVRGGDAAAAAIEVRAQSYPSANVPERRICGAAASSTTPAGVQLPDASMPYIAGPARLRAYVVAANNTAQVTGCEFGAFQL